LPDPRWVSWDPTLGKCYDLRPSFGRLFDDVAGLLDSFGEIEPRGLVLRYRNADGIGGAGHGFRIDVYETECLERSRGIDRTRQPISYDLLTEIGRRSSRGV
jgi:hypothetical protein